MNQFKNLKVWQTSMEIAEAIYSITRDFPNEERFALQLQIRRCAVSIASNIAEGAGRESQKEFKQFLSIAMGSSYELETQLLLAVRFEFILQEKADSILVRIDEVQRMLTGLKKSLTKD